MGRALRVPKSFPSAITSTRVREKLSCISSADSYGCSPSDCSNGKLPHHHRTFHKVGSAHFLPGRHFSVMGQESISRVFSYIRVYRMPARFWSSEPEIDYEEVERGSQVPSPTEEETDEDEAYGTEEDTDAETVSRREHDELRREGTSNKIRLYGKERGLDTDEESEWPETDETDDEEVQRVWQVPSGAEEETDGHEGYTTEEDTDAKTVSRSERDGMHREDTSNKIRLYGKDRGPDKLHSRDVDSDRWHGRDTGLARSIEKHHAGAYHRDGSSITKYIRDADSDYVEVESDLEGELQEEIERQMAAEPKFTRPSITWGILLTSDLRRKATETVIQYLDSEGINTSELTRIELPTAVEVMQTRLGFLRKIGLDNYAINSYPLVLGCSVRKNMVPVLKYLKKIGLTDHYLTCLLKKYPMVLHASVVIDILPVYYFLRGLDIDALDIPSVLSRYPDVLGFKTEGTMSTSVAYLVSLGVNTRHVGRMLTEYPEILGMRVAIVLKPKVDYLMSLGIPQLIVVKILERRPYILGYDLEQRMQYNVKQLLNIGVHQEAIPGMVSQFPELLGRVMTTTLESQLDWFKGKLEMDSDGVARLFEKMPQAIVMHREVIVERIRFLESVCFTAKEIGIMVAQCPQILVSSIRESLRPNSIFLTRELKRPRQEVVDFPACLTYDLETRIKPRLKALDDTDTEWNLEWLLNCSDGEFKKRVSAGFVGEEDTEHVFAMGGPLPGRLAKDDEWQPAVQPREHRSFAF